MRTRSLIISACLLVLVGIAARLLPHAPNMTPVTAIAFTGSLYLGKKWGVFLPGLALLLSDLVVGFYDWRIMLSVYGSFALVGILSCAAAKFRALIPVGFLVLAASIIFFAITNAAVWAFSPWYEKTISGLLYSYELGLPFLRNMLIGDMVYTIALVAAFEGVRAFYTLPRLSIRRARSAISAA